MVSIVGQYLIAFAKMGLLLLYSTGFHLSHRSIAILREEEVLLYNPSRRVLGDTYANTSKKNFMEGG